MRLVTSIVVALLLSGLLTACADRQPNSSAPKLWQSDTRQSGAPTPTVTLTEPAGGPTRERR